MNNEDVIAKTIGEITGKVIEKTVDIGDKFIKRYFRNHKKNIQDKADKNAKELIDDFAKRLHKLEKKVKKNKKQIKAINKNFDSPDFSKTLEISIKIASLTEDKNKKAILTSLLLHRLLVETESTEALILKNACEKIEYLNDNQLKILGLLVTIHGMANKYGYGDMDRERFTPQQAKDLLIEEFYPYYKVNVNLLDLEHLEYMNCFKMEYSVETFLEPKILPFEIYSNSVEKEQDFFAIKLGVKLYREWTDGHLQHARLSPVGQLIGDYVTDAVSESLSNQD